MGQKLIQDYKNDKIDWNFFRNIVNQCVESKFNSTEHLLHSIKNRVSKNHSFEKDVDFVNVSISKSDFSVKLFNNRFGINDSDDLASNKLNNAVVLVGDAAVTAHFRLGIGINSVFDQLEYFENFIIEIAEGEHFYKAAKVFDSVLSKHQEQVSQFEVLSILYEAYCDYLVFIDPNVTSLMDAMLIYGKDFNINDYNEFPYSYNEVVSNCQYIKNLIK